MPQKPMPALRAFPIIYAVTDVSRSAEFWHRLGFERFVALRSGKEAVYIDLRRGATELAVVAWDGPARRYGLKAPAGPRFEMYVYVEDLDTLLSDLRNDGIPILANVAEMGSGERVATIADPDGNPVTLCEAHDR